MNNHESLFEDTFHKHNTNQGITENIILFYLNSKLQQPEHHDLCKIPWSVLIANI